MIHVTRDTLRHSIAVTEASGLQWYVLAQCNQIQAVQKGIVGVLLRRRCEGPICALQHQGNDQVLPQRARHPQLPLDARAKVDQRSSDSAGGAREKAVVVA